MNGVLDIVASQRTARGEATETVYYLAWRLRPTHPWSSEEFATRMAAHQRYFALIERGIEAYLERRWRNK